MNARFRRRMTLGVLAVVVLLTVGYAVWIR